MKNLLAMDFGGSTGRGILGQFDGECLQLQEVHRFSNYYVNQNGTYFWDVYRLFHEILFSIKEVKKIASDTGLSSVGIDTWGTDYGLLDRNGQLLGNVRCMRNADGMAVQEVLDIVGSSAIFEATGLQTIPGNTVFQLYERMKKADPALLHADKMLMLPDLLGYFLTGIKKEEYTMATTSMCYNPNRKNWDYCLLEKLSLPQHIFADICYAGEQKNYLLPDLMNETGTAGLQYISVGTHDTASAVAATPLKADELFCSSGTWSLFGIETEEAVITREVELENFSNEGTVDGRFRLLKNIMGMWLIQECMREWQNQGFALTWNDLVQLADEAEPFESFLDTEAPEFYNAGNMIGKIRSYCAGTGQKVPDSIGAIARCIYQSIAMRYRFTMEQLNRITKRTFKALRIVGGGSRNRILNQYTANVLNLPVICGPVEAASIGNVLMQSIAHGDLRNITELRRVVSASFEMEEFYPKDTAIWKEAYGKYIEVISKKEHHRKERRVTQNGTQNGTQNS